MRPLQLLAEAITSARAQRVSALTIAVLTAAMCITTLMTVGRSSSVQAKIWDSIEQAGSQTLQIVNTSQDDLITPMTIQTVDSLESVQSTLARGLAFDSFSHNQGLGAEKVVTWVTHGDLAQTVDLVQGRWPGPGEAIVSTLAANRVNLDGPTGALDTADGFQYPIVGIYTTATNIEDISKGALVQTTGATKLFTLNVNFHNLGQARGTQPVILSILAPTNIRDLAISAPSDLADLQQSIAGDLTQYGTGAFLLVLGTGAFLTTVVVLADVLVRRKDLGRRRALGASRLDIIALVVIRSAIPALTGTILGTMIGVFLTYRLDAVPPWTFSVGTAILATITASMASVLPAILAAYRDPVTVLRTP